VTQIRELIAEKLGGSCMELVVKRYRTQVVAGVNFKVHATADGKDIVFKAFRPLPHTGESMSVSSAEYGSEL
jgi:hypothetical protein